MSQLETRGRLFLEWLTEDALHSARKSGFGTEIKALESLPWPAPEAGHAMIVKTVRRLRRKELIGNTEPFSVNLDRVHRMQRLTVGVHHDKNIER